MLSYLTLILGILVVVVSIWGSLRLARGRRLESQESGAGEVLRHAAQVLGLEEVRESRLYQASIMTAWGELNEFSVNCELWEQVHDPFYRVTIGFPKPLRRGLRISRDAQGGLMHRMMRGEEVEASEDAPGDLVVQSTQDLDELREFLQEDLRQPLERLAGRVDRLQLGDEYLFVFVKGSPEGAACESLLRESLAVASKVFHRAMALGPSKKSSLMSSYGQVESEMSRRVSEEGGPEAVEEARHTSRMTVASVVASSHEGSEASDEAVEGKSVKAAEAVPQRSASLTLRGVGGPSEVSSAVEVSFTGSGSAGSAGSTGSAAGRGMAEASSDGDSKGSSGD